jgi:hypothetical protein
MTEEVNTAEIATNTSPETERLSKIAETLKTLIKYAYVYGGPRKNLRQVVEVEATPSQLKIKYEDGTTQYIDPKLNRRFVILLYTKRPSRPYL